MGASLRDPGITRRLVAAGLALVLLLIAILLLLATGVNRGTQPGLHPVAGAADAAALRPTWSEGVRQSYAVELVSRVRFRAPQGGEAGEMEHILAGTLHMRVFEAGVGSALVGFQLAGVRSGLRGQEDPESADRLTTPFLVAFDRDARPIRFEFPSGLELREREQLREVIRTFQIVVPAGAEGSWITEEEHAAGVYRAHYRLEGGSRIQKQKTEYLRPAAGIQSMPGGRSSLIRSAEAFTVTSAVDWLAEARVESETAVTMDRGEVVRSTLLATLELLPGSTAATVTLFQTDASPDPARAIVDEVQVQLEQQRTMLEPGPEDVARLHAFIAALDSESAYIESLHALRDLLQRFPALADLVVASIKRNDIKDATASALIHVLELAATRQSQDRLAAIMIDRELSQMNRIRAVIAIGSSAEPSADSIEQVWRLYGDRADADSTVVSNTAALALGRMAAALRQGNGGEYAATQARLLGSLRSAADEVEAAVLLKALGNTADGSLAGEIASYLSSNSASVRAAAAKSLGSIANPDTVDLLTRQLQHERDGRVRASVAASLLRFESPPVSTLRAVHALVAAENDEAARLAMASLLAQHLDAFPDSRRTLSEMLRNDPNQRIRKLLAAKLNASR